MSNLKKFLAYIVCATSLHLSTNSMFKPLSNAICKGLSTLHQFEGHNHKSIVTFFTQKIPLAACSLAVLLKEIEPVLKHYYGKEYDHQTLNTITHTSLYTLNALGAASMILIHGLAQDAHWALAHATVYLAYLKYLHYLKNQKLDQQQQQNEKTLVDLLTLAMTYYVLPSVRMKRNPLYYQRYSYGCVLLEASERIHKLANYFAR